MIEIRSFRRVFDLERRIYSIDRFRLNPGGVPVRGVVYGLAAVSAALTLSAAPGVDVVAASVPWYLRDLIGPVCVAAVMTMVRVDGRPFHLAARGVIGMVASPRRLVGLAEGSPVNRRWIVPELLSFPDGSDPTLRRMRYRGPGAVLVQVEHHRTGIRERGRVGSARRAGKVRITGSADGQRLARAQVIALEPGGQASVEPF